MSTPTLRDFIEFLDREGELARVKTKVSPILEISEICDRVCKTPAPHGHQELDRNPGGKLGGKALLFENVEGSDIPVAINTFGSYWRVNQALGTENLECAGRARAAAGQAGDADDADGEDEAAAGPDEDGELSAEESCATGSASRSCWKGSKADLTRLPIIQCWPLDGDLRQRAGVRSGSRRRPRRSASAAPGDTSPSAASTRRNPETGDRNIGMYRVQVFGPRTMRDALAHAPRRRAAFPHVAKARREDAAGDRARRRIGVALRRHRPAAAGHRRDCSSPASSTARGIELVKCRTIDLEVPANAEIVIEGYVDPNEKLMEGPFGDHTGFYSLADWYPAFHVTAITHPEEPDLSDDDRRQAADGRLFPGQGHRADFPAAAEDDRSRTSSITACRSAACSTTARSSRSARNIRSRPGG